MQPEDFTHLLNGRVAKYEWRARFHLLFGILVLLGGFSFFVWDKHRPSWIVQRVLERHAEQVDNLILLSLANLEIIVGNLPRLINDYFGIGRERQEPYPIVSSPETLPMGTWGNPGLSPTAPLANSGVGELAPNQVRAPEAAQLEEVVSRVVDRAFYAWEGRIRNPDNPTIEEIKAWNLQIAAQYNELQSSLLATEQLLSDQFSQREVALATYASTLEEIRVNQEGTMQDLLARASPLGESLSYLESTAERTVFFVLVISLSSLFFINFRAASKRASQYEAFADAVTLGETDRELLKPFIEHLVQPQSVSRTAEDSKFDGFIERLLNLMSRNPRSSDAVPPGS